MQANKENKKIKNKKKPFTVFYPDTHTCMQKIEEGGKAKGKERATERQQNSL